MEIKFNGKRVLVTGGGRGIGREIAQRLVKCGAKTFVLTKSANSVENLKREDPEITVVQADITDWTKTREAVKSILPIDLLVNNAGIMSVASFLDVSVADIDGAFDTNYKGTFNISQIVAQDLISRGKPGAIVNVSSALSTKSSPQFSVYGSSKTAVDSLTRYMALELGPKQIRVNAVKPTVIPTDMVKELFADEEIKESVLSRIPLGRFGEKRAIADVVLFLLSDSASLINGATLPVDGGHIL